MTQRDDCVCHDEDPWADVPSVERARLRARGRSRLQEMGETEEGLAEAGISLEAAGCVERPHELLPYQIVRLKALGKKMARKHR